MQGTPKTAWLPAAKAAIAKNTNALAQMPMGKTHAEKTTWFPIAKPTIAKSTVQLPQCQWGKSM